MTKFLSIVLVVSNQALELEKKVREISSVLQGLGALDYELIVVDNGSRDNSLEVLRSLTSADGLENVQVFSLRRGVDYDSAAWVGVEGALGDAVVVMDPVEDDPRVIVDLYRLSNEGYQVVTAVNTVKPKAGVAYSVAQKFYHWLYRLVYSVRLSTDASRFRLLDRDVVTSVQAQHQPHLAFRSLPATAGFTSTTLEFTYQSSALRKRPLRAAIQQGTHLLLADSAIPMRVVVGLSVLGAVANLLYSGYVVIIALTKSAVAPGWVSLSLQSSAMFFLISIVLWMLAEYILHLGRLSRSSNAAEVRNEFTSVSIPRKNRLNVERSQPANPHEL
jgi:glycosyltransferase involved in cell wall biosynthesis